MQEATVNTVAARESYWERERERERNKIWNSGYRVWDRDNMSAKEMSIE
jgi:hypothetical protein